MKHSVIVKILINSHADQSDVVVRAAMQQGMPVPYGPIVCQKAAEFASEGSVLPEATMDAVEALVAYCNSEGIAVLPGVGSLPVPTFPRKREGS